MVYDTGEIPCRTSHTSNHVSDCRLDSTRSESNSYRLASSLAQQLNQSVRFGCAPGNIVCSARSYKGCRGQRSAVSGTHNTTQQNTNKNIRRGEARPQSGRTLHQLHTSCKSPAKQHNIPCLLRCFRSPSFNTNIQLVQRRYRYARSFVF